MLATGRFWPLLACLSGAVPCPLSAQTPPLPYPLAVEGPALRIDDGIRIICAAHSASATRVIGAFGVLADVVVKRLVAVGVRTRQYLVPGERFEGVLRENLRFFLVIEKFHILLIGNCRSGHRI